MKDKFYLIINLLFFNTIIFSQGVTFPSNPTQAPIGGLGLLVLGGAALAYEKLRRK